MLTELKDVVLRTRMTLLEDAVGVVVLFSALILGLHLVGSA